MNHEIISPNFSNLVDLTDMVFCGDFLYLYTYNKYYIFKQTIIIKFKINRNKLINLKRGY